MSCLRVRSFRNLFSGGGGADGRRPCGHAEVQRTKEQLTFTTRPVWTWRSPACRAAATKPASPPTKGIASDMSSKALPACEKVRMRIRRVEFDTSINPAGTSTREGRHPRTRHYVN